MSEVEPIRVLIVDDHSMVRTGLATFLRTNADLKLVGEARDGQQALYLCERLEPDVILMDLVMPRMDGVTATQAIRQRWPRVQIIALTSFKDKDLVQDALRAGAISYLLKDVSVDELAEAIRAAHAGRSTLAPEATQALIRTDDQTASPGHDLTQREREVLSLLAKGLSNAEIAQQLSITISTTKHHVSAILSKLGASSRAGAVVLAMEQGLTGESTAE
jgi:NarL family two-component system response regulator LiaR